MRLPVLLLLLILFPLPAAAQGGASFDPAVITTCLADGHGIDCIGRGAEACSMTSPGGGSNVGWNRCFEAERLWWDAELNNAYQQRLAEARRIDAEPPMPGLRPRPSDVEALRTMQRAWIPYRDATCAFEELQWWGGTGAGGASIECQARLTAQQTLYLRSLLSE